MEDKNKMPENKQAEIKEVEVKEETEIKNKIEIKNGKVTLNLIGSFKFNEVKIKNVTLDFNTLKGIDICDAESQALNEFYTPLPDTTYSTAYQEAIAAKALGLPFEAILEFKSKDFKMVTECAKGFLLG